MSMSEIPFPQSQSKSKSTSPKKKKKSEEKDGGKEDTLQYEKESNVRSDVGKSDNEDGHAKKLESDDDATLPEPKKRKKNDKTKDDASNVDAETGIDINCVSYIYML